MIPEITTLMMIKNVEYFYIFKYVTIILYGKELEKLDLLDEFGASISKGRVESKLKFEKA